MEKIQAVRGTKDLLPDSIYLWQFLFDKLKEISKLFNYTEIRTPIFEKTEVFHRSIGEATDIINKEMYTFTDKGGESITLRPEATAALVRSIIQYSLNHDHPILRLWYFGPFFRYERPQKGRLRQFHQYGAELIGSQHPEADLEIILLANELIKSIGVEDYTLLINSLGNDNSRRMYRQTLVNFLETNADKLSIESRNRLQINPLRILDSKDEQDIKLLETAPAIIDYLDDESKLHFEQVLDGLKELGINYQIHNKLVRGLDYYSHTVFEFRSNYLGSQDSFGGGGRYDGLFEQLGGKPTPAVGFAFGLERLLLILEQINKLPEKQEKLDYYFIIQNSKFYNRAQKIALKLREKGFSAIVEILRRSFKSQLREANKIGAKYAVIIGEEEFLENKVTVKNLTNSDQETITIDEFLNLSR